MSKTILITGASSGFGKGAALELTRRGHKVLAGVRSFDKGEALKAEAASVGTDIEPTRVISFPVSTFSAMSRSARARTTS